jgi:hypothetical protein
MRLIILASCFVCACGSSSKNSSANLTLTGQLLGGTYNGGSLSTQSAPNGPLAGYQLSCVTFGMPPVAASATADANGMLTLTLNALNIPFGCFVLDPNGNSVATVVFSSGSANGLTASFSENGNLGTITVDVNSGLAEVALTTGGTLVTSTPTATCPLGTWTVPFGGSSGCGMAAATAWIVQQPSKQYLVSFIEGPHDNGDAGCSYSSGSNIAATSSGGVLSFTVPAHDSTCPGSATNDSFTPDAQCQTAAIALAFTSCGTCGSAGKGCNGCGTQTCMGSLNATRK